MSDQPTIYVSNWSSHRTKGHHGPGRKWTIMARPRPWEMGAGTVELLVPPSDLVCLAKNEVVTIEEYRAHYVQAFRRRHCYWMLRPGHLLAFRCAEPIPVEPGDTLCCCCSRDQAALGRCHRVWAAKLLAENGWRVVLDGAVVEGCD
jgi:hypothetical protein